MVFSYMNVTTNIIFKKKKWSILSSIEETLTTTENWLLHTLFKVYQHHWIQTLIFITKKEKL